MKRNPYLPPAALLLALLALCLWNSRVMTAQTNTLDNQLRQVETQAESARWPAAKAALADSYADWSAHQTYLHIVTAHATVDDAEAMYRRAAAYAEAEALAEFRVVLADLRHQLRLLSEMERFSIKNVL